MVTLIWYLVSGGQYVVRYEMVTLIWYAGQLLAEFTNPGTR